MHVWVLVPKPLEGLTRSFNALALIRPLLSLKLQEELTCGCARLRRAQNSHSGRLDFIITVASVPWEVIIARQRSVHRHEHPERSDPMSLARRQTSGPDGWTHKPFHLLQVSFGCIITQEERRRSHCSTTCHKCHHAPFPCCSRAFQACPEVCVCICLVR